MLLPYVSNGIKDICKNDKVGKFKFAFRGGEYIGAPGKEIFFSLKNININQMKIVAAQLSQFFPKHKTPTNHVKWAACLRYIYGCFEKQGCLRSKEDQDRMTKEQPDWDLPEQFIDILKDIFEKDKNYYGLTILHEIRAHRLGDRCLIFNKLELLNEMIKEYTLSTNFASKINCVKHLFANWYWAGSYYAKCGQINKAIEFHKKNIEAMCKYCPDSREGYQTKAADSLKFLKNNLDHSDWIVWFKNSKSSIVNPDVKKWALWRKMEK